MPKISIPCLQIHLGITWHHAFTAPVNNLAIQVNSAILDNTFLLKHTKLFPPRWRIHQSEVNALVQCIMVSNITCRGDRFTLLKAVFMMQHSCDQFLPLGLSQQGCCLPLNRNAQNDNILVWKILCPISGGWHLREVGRGQTRSCKKKTYKNKRAHANKIKKYIKKHLTTGPSRSGPRHECSAGTSNSLDQSWHCSNQHESSALIGWSGLSQRSTALWRPALALTQLS